MRIVCRASRRSTRASRTPRDVNRSSHRRKQSRRCSTDCDGTVRRERRDLLLPLPPPCIMRHRSIRRNRDWKYPNSSYVFLGQNRAHTRMNPSDLAIDLRQVTKIYKGRVHALQGMDMRVRRGEVFGLLGPNGAGKSTLVKIIMTVIRPTTAQGTVLGSAVGHKPTLARVGYLPENHRFPRYLTGRQTLDFFAALSKVPRKIRKFNANRLLETVGMTEWADKRIGTYSKGMMQRIGLAQAMMNDPDLILLDEPTDGVDPVGRREIRDVLASLRAAGKTVFINSHQLSELEMICDRVAILIGGVVARQGTPDELSGVRMCYEIDVSAANGTPLLREELLRALPATFEAPSAAASIGYSSGEPRSPEDPRFAAAHAAAA